VLVALPASVPGGPQTHTLRRDSVALPFSESNHGLQRASRTICALHLHRPQAHRLPQANVVYKIHLCRPRFVAADRRQFAHAIARTLTRAAQTGADGVDATHPGDDDGPAAAGETQEHGQGVSQVLWAA